MTTHHRTALTAVRSSLFTVPDLHDAADLDGEPTAADLAAIDIESSLIAAEVAVVDAEVALVSAPHGPTDLAWQQLRRARRQVLREVAARIEGLRVPVEAITDPDASLERWIVAEAAVQGLFGDAA